MYFTTVTTCDMISIFGAARCQCYVGWEGHRCQHRDLSVSEWACEPGYTGQRCIDDLDECSNK